MLSGHLSAHCFSDLDIVEREILQLGGNVHALDHHSPNVHLMCSPLFVDLRQRWIG
jgi:hypothetical protein